MTEYPKEITKEDRFDWFPCEPSRLLGALAGMRSPKKLTYLIVLLRIYECGGACPDTVEALALRVGFNKRIVTEALSELCKEGRLYFAEGGFHNPKADDVIADSIALRERRKTAAENAGKRSAEKRKQKQQKEATTRSTNDQRFPTQLQLQEQDSLFSIENRVPDPPKPKVAKVPKTVAEPVAEPDDGWPSDHVEQFWQAFPPYRREGKRKVAEKLGKVRTSGVVGWDALIAAVRRYAATKPGEYACAPLVWLNGERWDREFGNANGGSANGENRNNRGPRLGFAGIAAKLRQSSAERVDGPPFFADAGDQQPDNGRRFASTPLGGMD